MIILGHKFLYKRVRYRSVFSPTAITSVIKTLDIFRKASPFSRIQTNIQ